MRIVAVSPFSRSIVPALSVTVAHEFEESVVWFSIFGHVLAADGAVVGLLLPLQEAPGEREESLWQLNLDSISSQQTRHRRDVQRVFYCPLEGHVLDYVESLRMKERKRDVQLSFDLSIDFASVNVSLGDFRHGQQIDEDSAVVLSSWRRPDSSNQNLRILVSPSQPFLQFKRLSTRLSHTITSSDWVHDFAPALGLGRVLVVEIAEPGSIAVDNAIVRDDDREFAGRLERAGTVLQQMNRVLQGGEWRDVVRQSREFWGLFQESSKQLDVRSFITTLITSSTGLEEEKSRNIVQAVGRLYGYASDLLHPIGDSGVKDVFVGGREDAYLAYSLAASFLNLVTRKFERYLEDRKAEA